MEKCLFLYNPYSGRGKIAKHETSIVERLSEKFDVEVVQSAYAGNIGDEIRKNGALYHTIVVAGGDGTLNEAVDAVMSLAKKPVIGYIPVGTVNDLAHSLGISTKIEDAVENILQGQPFAHDVMKINDKYGIYVCCAGVFTESSYATDQTVKKKMGKIAYFFHGLKKLFTTHSIQAKIIAEDQVIEGKYAIILAPNSRYVAGFKINKRAILNDGTVDLALVECKGKNVGLGAILRVARIFAFGLPKKSKKKTKLFRLNEFKLEMSSEHSINLDGEKTGQGSFEFKVEKAGIEILVPNIEKITKYNQK